jgi:hypothetical protein
VTGFVNYKLYYDKSFRYPPMLDTQMEDAAGGIVAIIHDLVGPLATRAPDCLRLVYQHTPASSLRLEDAAGGLVAISHDLVGSQTFAHSALVYHPRHQGLACSYCILVNILSQRTGFILSV